jgi:hypothetical protein
MNVEVVTRRTCNNFVNTAGNATLICDFYNNPVNCGTRGMPAPGIPSSPPTTGGSV